MQSLLSKFLFLVITLTLHSCMSKTKLIYKSSTPYGHVRFYAVSALQNKSVISKIYASVDSNNMQMYYSFYPDAIIKTIETAKQFSYTAYYDQLPLTITKVSTLNFQL